MFDQGSDEWLLERAGKVTASQIHNVMMKSTTAGYQNYMAQLICERLTGQPVETFRSAAMEHGNDTEPQARAFYEMETGLTVQEVGFLEHPSISGCGASPDGLVGEIGLVEIKCPQPAKHIKNLMGDAIDRNYLLQMQWQMACTGRAWCDFVSFNPAFSDRLQMSVRRVEINPETQEEMRATVTTFLAKMEAKLETLHGLAA